MLALVAMAMLSALPSDSAQGAIYWHERLGVGRANGDGSYADRSFINAGSLPGAVSVPCGDVAVNDSHVYWANPSLGTIGRANLDGSDQNVYFIGGAQNPCGVAVDESHVYWTNFMGESIGRAKLDGTEVDQSFVEAERPCGVALNDEFVFWSSKRSPVHIGRAPISEPAKDERIYEGSSDFDLCGLAVAGEHIYWGGFGDVIGKGKVDGTEVEDDFVSGIESPCGLAITDSYLYWSEGTQDGGIGRVGLDGSNISRGLVAGLDYSCGMAADSYVIPPPPPVPAPAKGQSACLVQKVKRNKRKGIVFARVIGPLRGHIGVTTRGVRFRRLSHRVPPVGGLQAWRWWVKIWPGKRGKAARRIRNSFKRRGWARIRLRVRCTERGKTPGVAARRLTLRRVR